MWYFFQNSNLPPGDYIRGYRKTPVTCKGLIFQNVLKILARLWLFNVDNKDTGKMPTDIILVLLLLTLNTYFPQVTVEF